MFKVTQYIRHPNLKHFSIERVFQGVRDNMPVGIDVVTHYCRHPSSGIWHRLHDIFAATKTQGDVNHITGDVHYLVYLLRHRKTILTIHDCEILSRTRGVKHWLLWFFWFWLPEKCSTRIVAISLATKMELLHYLNCSPEKILIIHDPVSSGFRPLPKLINSTKQRILQIGTKENKNLARLVEAVSGLNIVLVIVGVIPKDIIDLMSKYHVTYENHVGLSDDELRCVYETSDMLAFVSLKEGFGLPIIEAQAIGRPVVTSSISSMPEVAGSAACLVDPYDVACIRAGIRRVMDDANYRERIILLGFENVKRFSPELIAQQYADLYKQVASNA